MTDNLKTKFNFADRLGYIPSYIFAKLDDEKQKLISSGVDIIDLSLGSPNLPTPDSVLEECKKAIHDPQNYRYPPFKGQKKFKEAASTWLKQRFNTDLDPNREILPLTGSKEGLAHLAFAVINPGDLTIVPSPYYPVHARGTLLAGGQIYELPLLAKNDFLMDLDSVPEEVYKKAKILFVNYPNNPTGAICDLAYFEKLVNICKKYQIILVSDLAYSELTFDGFVAPSIFQVKGAKDIAIEFHTFSKTYSMAGWRIAFVTGNSEILDALYEVKTNTDYGVCNISQATSIRAFSIPQEEIKKTALIYQERRDVMYEKIKELGWNIPLPKGAMYLWLPIPKQYTKSFDFSRDLLNKAHVSTIPGASFGNGGEGFVRIALVDNKERLIEATSRMKQNGFTFS